MVLPPLGVEAPILHVLGGLLPSVQTPPIAPRASPSGPLAGPPPSVVLRPDPRLEVSVKNGVDDKPDQASRGGGLLLDWTGGVESVTPHDIV